MQSMASRRLHRRRAQVHARSRLRVQLPSGQWLWGLGSRKAEQRLQRTHFINAVAQF